jgi:lipoprotein-anchoring transpeptidase ErfK/SrfK
MVQRGSRSGRFGRSAPWLLGASALVAALALGACTSKNNGDPGTPPSIGQSLGSVSSSTPPESSSAAPAPHAVITSSLKRTTDVNPTVPVSFTVADGTIKTVTMTNSEGKKVKGSLSDDGTTWRSTEYLGYSKTYKVTATAANGDGVLTTKKMSLSTLTPSNMTMPYFDTIYGSSMVDGDTYGVGMIPVVHFDEVIPDQAAAEKALHVTTSPHVEGSWYWDPNGQSVHWRPREFYQPGTKVTITAKVYGVDVGDGMYGQSDKSISFRIGERHIAIADAATHHVKVYFGGKMVRSMPTSMGRGGTTTGDHGQTIYLWTMPGTYTVIGHENPATMSSDSYGLPKNSPYGYGPLKVPFATKISTDGIYLHELDSTVGVQGYQNVSHGCLNLNYENAKWYFDTSRVGDVVQVVHSGGPKIQFWQGGDWAMSWSDWLKGSALH